MSVRSTKSSATCFRTGVPWDCVLIWLILLEAATACPNPIVCENLLPGDTGWIISGTGDTSIQGFAASLSVNAGETVEFKVDTDAAHYRLDIYRLGFYGGNGARKIITINPSFPLPHIQPPCLTDPQTKLVDCGNWAVSASWEVPDTAVSGTYVALLTRPDTDGVSHILFVVRNDASRSDILFKTSDETWQAYNYYGGSSLEGGNGSWDLSKRSFQVSYNRPFYTRAFENAAWFFSSEYAMIRWLEANGYDVSYFTSVDAAMSGHLILNHKILFSVGRDEYVSGPQRQNLEAARDAGVHLAFFSGTTAFWKTRWDRSIDGSKTPFRTLVCYKETLENGTPNPTDPLTWTGTWRDSRFSPPSDGANPENSLTGSLFMVNTVDTNLSIEVPAADGRMRFWRNTSIATLPEQRRAILPAGTLGSKWAVDIDNGVRPIGLIPVSTAAYSLTEGLLLDHGATFGAGAATHRMGVYKALSGALVFSAGTDRWSWGLDEHHDGKGPGPDLQIQQATVNLLADMDAQPATPQPLLALATKSSDAMPPTSTVTSPLTLTLQYGVEATITGTASDTGGGVIGSVEVSTNNGRTWHRADGREEWTYRWTPFVQTDSITVIARAFDDSGNAQSKPTAASFKVVGSSTIWSDSSKPDLFSDETKPVELGMKFRSDVTGYVIAVRFYKGIQNTGTHIGSLWSSDGKRLASATFTNETNFGWQRAFFPSPVRISAHTTYVISYYAPNGGYAASVNFFSKGVNHSPLHSLADGVDGPNGVYFYQTGGGFPNQTFNATNYWVDVEFSPSTGKQHTVSLSWTASTSPNIVGHNLYRATTSGGPYKKLNPLPLTATTYLDDDVASGVAYFYTATAIDSATNESPYSDEVKALIPGSLSGSKVPPSLVRP